MGMRILAFGEGGSGEGGWEVGMTISLTARISHESVYSRNSLQRRRQLFLFLHQVLQGDRRNPGMDPRVKSEAKNH